MSHKTKRTLTWTAITAVIITILTIFSLATDCFGKTMDLARKIIRIADVPAKVDTLAADQSTIVKDLAEVKVAVSNLSVKIDTNQRQNFGVQDPPARPIASR